MGADDGVPSVYDVRGLALTLAVELHKGGTHVWTATGASAVGETTVGVLDTASAMVAWLTTGSRDAMDPPPP